MMALACAGVVFASAFHVIAQGPPAPPVQPPAQFESGAVTITQANADAWLWVPFTRTFAKPPVVVMGPSTRADAAAAIVTAVDVYTNGFYCQINEWDYLDGAHAAETVHFFALTEGSHNFGGQIWQVGKIPAVNRTAVSQPLTGFTSTPVVLTQVHSYNNWTSFDGVQAIKTRINNVTNTGFQVQLETEEAAAAQTLFSEGVSYIAVSQGTGYLDGKVLSAVRTSAATTHTLATVTFPAARTNPIFVAQTQTINDTDPGELRMASLTTASVQVHFQEETSVNADVTHAAEAVGYLAIGDMAGEVAAKLEVGEVLVTQSNATTWTTVNLAKTYTAAVVVMGPLSYTNSTSLTVRVRNVTSTSFEFQVDRWDHHTAAHNALEMLSYIVMESGSYAIGGVRWQAGRSTAVTQTPATQSLSGFPAAPVVFAQVATTNDPQAVQARVSAVTQTSFAVELNESEIDTTPHASEAVHWIAMMQGTSNFFSTAMRIQAGTGTNQDSSFRVRTFSRMHADPYLFASLQTKNDVDPATLRWRYLFADKVELVAQEDAHPAQPGEGTVNNTHSAETVAFLVVQGAPDRDGDGAPDAWETAVGLNADNASDGSLDPDNDLLTNQQEYHNRLNFTTSTLHNSFTGGVVTVGNAVTSGYERNDVTANPVVSTQPRFRVYRNGGFAPITVNITMAGTAATDTNRAPASSSDYSAWTAATGGTEITTSIALPANAQSVDIYIRPVVDDINEYPEGLRLTAGANTAVYTLGSATSTVVMIYDAMDIAANEKLFVGTFMAQSGVTSSASGFATLILNGPNNAARISTTFNGLTTPQTDIDGSHVHFVGGTIVYGEPDGLPNGQLVEYPWTIVDSAGYKGQRLIDALFRLNSEYLYVNVHTTRYAGGEIRAELARVNAGPFQEPAAPPALENLTTDEQVRRECVRFLTQATFGASETDVTALYNSIVAPKTTAANRITAFSNWINAQWALDQTSLYDYHLAANAQEWALWGQQPNLPAVADDPATTTVNETYPAAPPPNNPLDWTRWGVVPSPAGAWTYRPVPPGLNKESYDPDHNNRRRGWWSIANRAHDQLRQRTAFALEQIFVVSDREGTVQTRTFGHSRYFDMLADHADGVRQFYPAHPTSAYSSPPALLTGYTSGSAVTVRDLLEDVSKSPIMGKYLSHLQNQKAVYTDTNGSGVLGDTVNGVTDEIILSPDENYAREIMQLFSIGLLMLHPDGTIQIGAGGQPQATYDNDDIKELSRVFTGWSYSWSQNSAANGYVPPTAHTTNFFGSAGAEYFHPGYEAPMKPFANYHDLGAKTVLGASLPAYTGSATDTAARETYAEADLDAALNVLFNHQNIAPFLSKLLIQRLVTSNPSRGYVYRVAQVFQDSNGAAAGGVRGSIKDVVRAILLDYEARSLTYVDPQTINSTTSVNVSYGKVKEPIIRYVQVLRAFNARSQIDFNEAADSNDLVGYGYPASQLDNLGATPTRFRYGDTVGVLGQTPNNMPSVFNWYLPDYSPGGRLAAAGLYAPELQIMGENMVVNNVNYHRSLDYVGIIDPNAALPTGVGVSNLLGDGPGLLDNINVDLSQLTAEYKANRDTTGSTNITAATYLVDRLDALLCAGSLKAKYTYTTGGEDPRSALIDQLALISPTTTNPLPIANAGARVRAALYLITLTPEFIVQK
jgi:uncharacterized protein (DUF1800 family)